MFDKETTCKLSRHGGCLKNRPWLDAPAEVSAEQHRMDRAYFGVAHQAAFAQAAASSCETGHTPDAIRNRIIYCDVVELPDGHVVVKIPRLGAVIGHVQTAVIANKNSVGIVRVNLDCVEIDMRRIRNARSDCLAPVVRNVYFPTEEIDSFAILRINCDAREVERSRIEIADSIPCLAVVI